MQKKLTALLITTSLSVLSTTNLSANSNSEQEKPVSCEEVLESCDEALDAADEALTAQEKEIQALLDAQKVYNERIQLLEKKNASIFRNPAFTIAVGFVGGLVLGVVITK